jgi:hypothetical protein
MSFLRHFYTSGFPRVESAESLSHVLGLEQRRMVRGPGDYYCYGTSITASGSSLHAFPALTIEVLFNPERFTTP